jgi:AraC-like DNA-binding protein
VPVRFDQPVTGLVLPQSSFALPVLKADPEAFAVIQRAADALLRSNRLTWTGRVARCLRAALASGGIARSDIAAQLGLNHRAMARRLAEEGTSFQAQLDTVRHHAALELLALTDLDAGDIALSVGYQNPAAFSAAFRRWSGTTPVAWRAKVRAGHPAQ